jgi:hypothetical protein
MIMSRLGIYASVVLTCAGLVLTPGIGRTASATEECGQRYKSCNWSCQQPFGAADKVIACKSRCDLRLIACDRQPTNAAAQGGRYSPQGLPANANSGVHPVADGGNGR